MDDELKKKWVDALRSGKYEQGKHFLKCGNSFCCLGVLADLMDENWTATSRGETAMKFGRKKQAKIFLHEDILPMSLQFRLSDMNDAGYSFEELASYIETGTMPKMIDNGEEKDD